LRSGAGSESAAWPQGDAGVGRPCGLLLYYSIVFFYFTMCTWDGHCRHEAGPYVARRRVRLRGPSLALRHTRELQEYSDSHAAANALLRQLFTGVCGELRGRD